MNPYSALDWVSSRFRASSSFMRVFWLQGSSAVFRLPSIFENALMRDYALAYSARISSGYSVSCFSYESLGACLSTWSAAYCLQPLAISVLLRRCLTLCARILYSLCETFSWTPARTAISEKLADSHMGRIGVFCFVMNNGFEGILFAAFCLLPREVFLQLCDDIAIQKRGVLYICLDADKPDWNRAHLKTPCLVIVCPEVFYYLWISLVVETIRKRAGIHS